MDRHRYTDTQQSKARVMPSDCYKYAIIFRSQLFMIGNKIRPHKTALRKVIRPKLISPSHENRHLEKALSCSTGRIASREC